MEEEWVDKVTTASAGSGKVSLVAFERRREGLPERRGAGASGPRRRLPGVMTLSTIDHS